MRKQDIDRLILVKWNACLEQSENSQEQIWNEDTKNNRCCVNQAKDYFCGVHLLFLTDPSLKQNCMNKSKKVEQRAEFENYKILYYKMKI